MNFSRVKTFSPMSVAHASKFMEGISQAMQLNRTDVLLDVGCGVGALTALLSKRVARVTAFDISPEMIKEAKQISKAKNITYSVSDATKLSTYQEYRNSFDKVVANFALHWMKDYKTALEGIYQSLKPGGQCFMNMSQQNPNVLDIVIVLNSYTSPKWEAFMKGYEPAYYPFKGSIDDYKQMLTSIGFKDIECTQEIAHHPIKYEEAKDYYPNFMGQLGRIPEDRRDEYVEEVLVGYWP
ncbi:juvenile hormone acid O-methyltransferase-like isoform X3 [Ptychodera flava]|uniref:juvenile hormone acid O-methyltransferase-like isoform X3 n=1 Tax=Ptychodera flava TaxID=63121 RepID=UPI00396A0EA3